jgi:hypothetical protein
MAERIINGRVAVSPATAGRALGLSKKTVIRRWEEGLVDGFRGTRGRIFLYWDSVLKLRDDELKNDAP